MDTLYKIIILLYIFSNSFYSQPQWQQLNSGTTSHLHGLFFISENLGWVVGFGGVILKTTNGGGSWNQLNSNTSSDLLSVFFLNDQIGWVGGRDGLILNTTNGGENWSSSLTGFNTEDMYSIIFYDENTGLAVIGNWTPYYYGYIIKTTDSGNSWQSKLFVYDDGLFDIEVENQFGWTVGTSIMYRTSNYGESWSNVYSPTPQWLFEIFSLNESKCWAVGGLGPEVIIETLNGGISWFILKEFYEYKRLYDVSFIDDANGWIVGEYGLIKHTTDSGSTWEIQNSPSNSILREIQFPTHTVGYITGENGTILKYSDNLAFINVLDPNGGEVITAGSSYYILWNSQNVIDVKLEYSTDNGINWINIIDSLPSTGIYNWTVPNTFTSQARVKILDLTDPGIFDVSDGPFTIQSSKVITVVSPNGGEELEGGSTYEIQWNSTDVEYVKIQYSINNGASWNIVIDSTQSSGAYIWDVPNILTIQGRIKISDITIPSIYDVSDNSFRINYTTGVHDLNNISTYRLSQNYPNPFNPITLIEYSVPEYTYVVLNVYDVLGKLVSTLVSENRAAGNYSVEFSGSDLPSGLYFYNIVTKDFIATKKMILLK